MKELWALVREFLWSVEHMPMPQPGVVLPGRILAVEEVAFEIGATRQGISNASVRGGVSFEGVIMQRFGDGFWMNAALLDCGFPVLLLPPFETTRSLPLDLPPEFGDELLPSGPRFPGKGNTVRGTGSLVVADDYYQDRYGGSVDEESLPPWEVREMEPRSNGDVLVLLRMV